MCQSPAAVSTHCFELLNPGGCLAGYGGHECEKCQSGFYSKGGTFDYPRAKCKPCGPHLTSPEGAVSVEYCECEAGYGADDLSLPMEDRRCVPCPYGSFNPGNMGGLKDPNAEDASLEPMVSGIAGAAKPARVKNVAQILACQRCSARNPAGAFTTLEVGARSSRQCVCKAGYGGLECTPCEEVSMCEICTGSRNGIWQ